MKPALLALAVLLALPGIAEAACSTASAAGTWRIAVSNSMGEDVCPVSVASTGVVAGTCRSGLKASGKIALASDCRITGSILGAAVTGRTEALDPKSTLKPNIMMLYGDPARVGTVAGYRM